MSDKYLMPIACDICRHTNMVELEGWNHYGFFQCSHCSCTNDVIITFKGIHTKSSIETHDVEPLINNDSDSWSRKGWLRSTIMPLKYNTYFGNGDGI